MLFYRAALPLSRQTVSYVAGVIRRHRALRAAAPIVAMPPGHVARPPPHDLDVLVIGGPRREDVYDAADQAQKRLGMPVNPVIRTGDAWRKAIDPLARQIQSSPLVAVLVPDSEDAGQALPNPGRHSDCANRGHRP
jgi:hypothetical protein